MSQARRVVVIGSGPAGAMAAWELVRHGIPVTLLESGTAAPAGLLVRAGGRNLFRRTPPMSAPVGTFVNAGDPGTMWMSNLALGGLSNQWTGAVPRFAPEDFTEGARLDERYRWPLSYDDLAPFYGAAERLLRITGPGADQPALPGGMVRYRRQLPPAWQTVAHVARRHGQGLGVLPLADGPSWMLTRRSTAFNSYSTILRRLQKSPLFELRPGIHALQLVWSGAQRRIEAAVYYDRERGHQGRIEADAFVVACGALRSTKLLFDSACPDFPDGIGNSEGLLGRYFHDHPKEWWTFEIDGPLPRLTPAAYLTRRPYTDVPPLLATSWTIGNTSNLQKVLALTPLRTHRFAVQVFGTMRPTEDRYVAPSPTALDEHGLPQLELCIRFTDEEIDNVVSARGWLLDLFAESGHACRLHPVEPQLAPGNAVHYGGTIRMHQSPRYGVLNEWNRPFDVPNLVVADASCFTTNSEKNPTLTLMALSARAARRLAHDLKAGVT